MDIPHTDNEPILDIHEQARTYSVFIRAMKWAMVLHAVAGVFLVMAFFTEAGFFAAVAASLLVFIGGVSWLRASWKREHPHRH